MKQIIKKEEVAKILAEGQICRGDTYFGDSDERFCELDGRFASGSTLSYIQGAIEWRADEGPIYTIKGEIVAPDVVSEYKRLRKQQIRNSKGGRFGSKWRGWGCTQGSHNSQVEALEKTTNLKFPALYDCVEYAKMCG